MHGMQWATLLIISVCTYNIVLLIAELRLTSFLGMNSSLVSTACWPVKQLQLLETCYS